MLQMWDLVTPLVKELRKELYSDFCCADNIFATSDCISYFSDLT